MKVAIVGSRGYPNLREVADYVVYRLKPGDVLVSGGATGVDRAAEAAARAEGLETLIYYPEWELYGKRAGFMRNEMIVLHSDRVVAFWDGKSRGTKDSIDKALKAGKPLEVFFP